MTASVTASSPSRAVRAEPGREDAREVGTFTDDQDDALAVPRGFRCGRAGGGETGAQALDPFDFFIVLGNGDADGRAFAGGTLDVHATREEFDELFRDVEAEACAFVGTVGGAVHLIKFLKEPIQLVGGDSDARVLYAEGEAGRNGSGAGNGV